MPEGKYQRQHRQTNPLVQGIAQYFEKDASDHIRNKFWRTSSSSATNILSLQSSELPRRYTVYPPMLMVGPSFDTYSLKWGKFWQELNEQSNEERDLLWKRVLENVNRVAGSSGGGEVRVVAKNAPIQPVIASEAEEADDRLKANLMRSPTGLLSLYGDLGPDSLLNLGSNMANHTRNTSTQPTTDDFNAALWVETTQVKGIIQVWAPRWTMFSRGNIREKERIVGGRASILLDDPKDHAKRVVFPGLSHVELNENLDVVDVVDFYVGIGYFAFCYLKRGVKRVWGWDLNGWSIEGIKRGCERNGWSCLVVKVNDGTDGIQRTAEEVAEHLKQQDFRCVVFQGDNACAAQIMKAIQSLLKGLRDELNVRHCNLGLLPSSRESWNGAMTTLNLNKGGWLHVHENAKIDEVEEKRETVLQDLQHILPMQGIEGYQISCEHVEMVKTYAPGVGHFVFDMKLWPTG